MSHEHAAAGATAIYTAASGVAAWFDIINGGFATIAVVSGVVLTWVLIRKHLVETKIMQESNGRRNKEERKTKRKKSEGK